MFEHVEAVKANRNQHVLRHIMHKHDRISDMVCSDLCIGSCTFHSTLYRIFFHFNVSLFHSDRSQRSQDIFRLHGAWCTTMQMSMLKAMTSGLHWLLPATMVTQLWLSFSCQMQQIWKVQMNEGGRHWCMLPSLGTMTFWNAYFSEGHKRMWKTKRGALLWSTQHSVVIWRMWKSCLPIPMFSVTQSCWMENGILSVLVWCMQQTRPGFEFVRQRANQV